jgi:AraC family transcriptional activator of mtrCDE
MDLLDEILDTLDLKGVMYFRTDFNSDWSVTVPDLDGAARFHLVVQGECHVRFESGQTIVLGPGDLVLIPRGRSHILSDKPVAEAPSLEQVLQDADYDNRGVLVLGEANKEASTQMVCGHFSLRAGAEHPLLSALPDHMFLSGSARARSPWLDEVLRLIAQRIFRDPFGSSASVTRLSEIAFIELIRAGLGDGSNLDRILEAFRDPHIGKSLELIHARPGESWTVERLARDVGMSRSRFAVRFSDLLGIAPMAYLSNWRLQRALALLEDKRRSVQQVSSEIGYQSQAAFTRAFAGKFGLTPSEYRRAAA